MGSVAQKLERNSINTFAGSSALLRYGITKGLELRTFIKILISPDLAI
tara:strand:+ start:377 stop:520 length:144 start_codon:yes stop_codon:yes gene_type:complete